VDFGNAAADNPNTFWTKPLLRQPFIEANCYRCHTGVLTQTPAFSQGKSQFETRGCLGCHKRDGKGGMAGSELRGIGDAKVHTKLPITAFEPALLTQLNHNQNLVFIYGAVRFPKAQAAETMMFDFQISHEDTMALTVYLKSLTKYPLGTQRLPNSPEFRLPITENGEKLFQLYCNACHGIKGKGGVKNPNYINDYIPKLNTISEQMFLHKKENQDAVISILDNVGDLLEAGLQPDIPGFFKVVAKYMPVKNTIENGRKVEKKDKEGPAPLNMPTWDKSLTKEEISSVIAYLISVY